MTEDHTDTDEVERESFPASDPPSTWAGTSDPKDASPEPRTMDDDGDDDDDKGEDEPDDDDDGDDGESVDDRVSPAFDSGAR